MTPADETFSPGATFGRYQIIERIGEGGMASVWKALHLGLRKPVAIKTLRADLTQSEKARARFLREGEAIARIRHAHVVEVHDVGIAGETPYLVMEFLEGEDLRERFLRSGALPLGELADLMVPVCAAIASAHDVGVVHRDIKPGNLFLARTLDRGVVPKVLDFGVSRLDDRTGRVHTGTSVVLGTPRYMAPEQVRGARDVDARADQYALGVILYQGSTGQVPIDEPAIFELLRRVVNGEFARPRQLRPDLPVAFERAVLRAMATRPDDRFPSVRELGAELLPFASERTRVIHGDAFGVVPPRDLMADAPPMAPVAPIPVVAAAPPPFRPSSDPHATTMTLGDAPLELPAPSRASPEVRALSGFLAGIAVIAFGLSLWLATRSAPVASARPAAPSAPSTPPLAMVPAPSAPPVPVVSTLRVAPSASPSELPEVPTPAAPVAPRSVARPPRSPSTPQERLPRSARPPGAPATRRPVVGVNPHDID